MASRNGRGDTPNSTVRKSYSQMRCFDPDSGKSMVKTAVSHLESRHIRVHRPLPLAPGPGLCSPRHRDGCWAVALGLWLGFSTAVLLRIHLEGNAEWSSGRGPPALKEFSQERGMGRHDGTLLHQLLCLYESDGSRDLTSVGRTGSVLCDAFLFLGSVFQVCPCWSACQISTCF